MSRLNQWNDQALRLAGQVGDTIKDAMPDRALRWVETGAALGALKTGSRTAGKFVRRHPVALAAAAAGAGLLWYTMRQRAKRKADGASHDEGEAIEGRARRVEARRARSGRRAASADLDTQASAQS
ncbi:MAG TPA: hypothetical protein VLM17_05090 [Xanthomonadaceae bacterium]|nr:hypothetical protein [Xanthomonadaceae bacterium]